VKHHHDTLASGNTGPGGGIHIGTAVVTHGPGHAGTLPFTGLDLTVFVAIATVAMIAGLFSRRWADR